jgi:hypothetical protein
MPSQQVKARLHFEESDMATELPVLSYPGQCCKGYCIEDFAIHDTTMPMAEYQAEKIRTALVEAWGEGYDKAESDHAGTGFWAKGLRSNPYGKEAR